MYDRFQMLVRAARADMKVREFELLRRPIAIALRVFHEMHFYPYIPFLHRTSMLSLRDLDAMEIRTCDVVREASASASLRPHSRQWQFRLGQRVILESNQTDTQEAGLNCFRSRLSTIQPTYEDLS